MYLVGMCGHAEPPRLRGAHTLKLFFSCALCVIKRLSQHFLLRLRQRPPITKQYLRPVLHYLSCFFLPAYLPRRSFVRIASGRHIVLVSAFRGGVFYFLPVSLHPAFVRALYFRTFSGFWSGLCCTCRSSTPCIASFVFHGSLTCTWRQPARVQGWPCAIHGLSPSPPCFLS